MTSTNVPLISEDRMELDGLEVLSPEDVGLTGYENSFGLCCGLRPGCGHVLLAKEDVDRLKDFDEPGHKLEIIESARRISIARLVLGPPQTISAATNDGKTATSDAAFTVSVYDVRHLTKTCIDRHYNVLDQENKFFSSSAPGRQPLTWKQILVDIHAHALKDLVPVVKFNGDFPSRVPVNYDFRGHVWRGSAWEALHRVLTDMQWDLIINTAGELVLFSLATGFKRSNDEQDQLDAARQRGLLDAALSTESYFLPEKLCVSFPLRDWQFQTGTEPTAADHHRTTRFELEYTSTGLLGAKVASRVRVGETEHLHCAIPVLTDEAGRAVNKNVIRDAGKEVALSRVQALTLNDTAHDLECTGAWLIHPDPDIATIHWTISKGDGTDNSGGLKTHVGFVAKRNGTDEPADSEPYAREGFGRLVSGNLSNGTLWPGYSGLVEVDAFFLQERTLGQYLAHRGVVQLPMFNLTGDFIYPSLRVHFRYDYQAGQGEGSASGQWVIVDAEQPTLRHARVLQDAEADCRDPFICEGSAGQQKTLCPTCIVVRAQPVMDCLGTSYPDELDQPPEIVLTLPTSRGKKVKVSAGDIVPYQRIGDENLCTAIPTFQEPGSEFAFTGTHFAFVELPEHDPDTGQLRFPFGGVVTKNGLVCRVDPAGEDEQSQILLDLSLSVEDEGTEADPNVRVLDFVGSGVTATKTATGEVEVNISGGATNAFSTHDCPSGTDPVADAATDTLTWLATSPITITGDSAADSITVASTFTEVKDDTTPQAGGNWDWNGKTQSDALGDIQIHDEVVINPTGATTAAGGTLDVITSALTATIGAGSDDLIVRNNGVCGSTWVCAVGSTVKWKCGESADPSEMGITWDPGNDKIQIILDGSVFATCDADGLGIETSNPLSCFHGQHASTTPKCVTCEASDSGETGTHLVNSTTGTTTSDGAYVELTSAENLRLRILETAGNIIFEVSSGEAMRISENEAVSIGTTAEPSANGAGTLTVSSSGTPTPAGGTACLSAILIGLDTELQGTDSAANTTVLTSHPAYAHPSLLPNKPMAGACEIGLRFMPHKGLNAKAFILEDGDDVILLRPDLIDNPFDGAVMQNNHQRTRHTPERPKMVVETFAEFKKRLELSDEDMVRIAGPLLSWDERQDLERSRCDRKMEQWQKCKDEHERSNRAAHAQKLRQYRKEIAEERREHAEREMVRTEEAALKHQRWLEKKAVIEEENKRRAALRKLWMLSNDNDKARKRHARKQRKHEARAQKARELMLSAGATENEVELATSFVASPFGPPDSLKPLVFSEREPPEYIAESFVKPPPPMMPNISEFKEKPPPAFVPIAKPEYLL